MNLLKISITLSIIGIFLLLFISDSIQPKPISIKEITDLKLNQKIQLTGKIISIKTYKESDFQITTLEDSTGKIAITSPIINLSKNQTITVQGKITEYKNNLQIKADKIILNNG